MLTIALISHASKIMLKILQARLQQYVNREPWTVKPFQIFKLLLEKAEEPEIKLPISAGSLKKQVSSRKNIYFCFIDYANTFDCVDHNKLWKILIEMGIQTIWPASWETCMQVRKQHLELDMEQ